MGLKKVIVVLSLCAYVGAIVGPAGNGTKSSVQKTDTYLEAYSKSRIEAEKAKQGVIIVTAKDGETKISNRDDSFSGYDYPAPSYSGPETFSSSGYSGISGPSSSASNNYLPPSNSYSTPIRFSSETTYNQPANTYGPPANAYGPPAHSYGPPTHTYGPPAQNYGPPAQSYGPPIHRPLPPVPIYGPPINHGIPYHGSGLGFLDKFKLKLDILTIAKLLLKLFIFKKLVTMLAVVCMLLVIPKLIEFKKHSNGLSNDEGDDRKFGDDKEVRLTSAYQVLERAMKVYRRQEAECGITCRVQRVLDDIYDFEPYVRSNAFSTPDPKES